jgi:hypothetical protein
MFVNAQIKEDEMGEAYRSHSGYEIRLQNFGYKVRKVETIWKTAFGGRFRENCFHFIAAYKTKIDEIQLL